VPISAADEPCIIGFRARENHAGDCQKVYFLLAYLFSIKVSYICHCCKQIA
jgi:hypothetical protein